MKLQQLRFIREVARQNLNVTAAAESLFTSQPGISKQIRLLEEELGVLIFERNGKNLSRITEPGKRILALADEALRSAGSIQKVAEEFRNEDIGSLSVGTTHTQARYALPPAIAEFRRRYPKVSLHIHQGTPQQIADWAAHGEVDFAIATEAMHLFDELVMLPCYRWNRCVLVPPGHPLIEEPTLSLKAVADFPLITYVFGFTGRSKLDQAFLERGLKPEVVLTATDADVIKTYVKLGLGIGIVANMAFDATTESDLVALDASHLFDSSITNIGFRRGSYLKRYMVDFMTLFSPNLSAKEIEHVAALPSGKEQQARIKQIAENVPKR